MRKVSGKNSKIRFFRRPGVLQRSVENRYIKNSISPPEFTMGMNPFRLLLVSPRPTYGRNMESNGVNQLETFPRKWYYSVIPDNTKQGCFHLKTSGSNETKFLNSLTSALVKTIYSVIFSWKYMHFYHRESDILLPVVRVSVGVYFYFPRPYPHSLKSTLTPRIQNLSKFPDKMQHELNICRGFDYV